MSANSAVDGADANENSNGNGSAISSDPGLLRSEEGISVNIESSDATSEEVGVIADSDLVNSSEGGTVIAAEESNSYADAEFSVTLDAHQAYDTVVGKMGGGVGDGTSNNHAGKLDIVDVHSSLEQVDDQVTNDNGILINMDRSTQDQSDDENHYEDAGKEEMFVDAPDHMTAVEGRVLDGGEFKATDETGLGDSEKDIDVRVIEGESQAQGMADDLVLLHAQLDKAIAEKELVARECNEYKDEREVLAREICKFHHQLQALSYQHSLLMEDRDGLVDRLRRVETEGCEVKAPASDMPLHVMVGECSKLTSVLTSSLDEQLQCEGTVRELNAVLFTKDQEIEDLNAKVTELSVSRDVLLSYMNSLQKMWTESLQESALHLEVFTDRSLASLASVVPQGDMSHISVTDKISLAEKSTALLIENYTRFLSGINHLGQCLAEVSSDFTMSQENEFGVIFELAHEELLGHKSRESDLIDKLQRLEENNQKLLEELDKAKQRLDEANTGANEMKAELEQVEVKLASSKEKLSMAVTKGKALVQQRDSLRQSLNEKTNDLEKCLLGLQQKSSALEAAEVIKEEMIKSKNLVTSLEESVSERNMVLKELEELMSLANSPEEVQSLPVIDRMRWLVNQKSILEGAFLESRKVKDALSLIDIPDTVSSAELESQISWLGRSFAQAKDELTKLQGEFAGSLEAVASHESELSEASKEIEHIKGSLLEEKLEKDSLQARLEDLTHKYEGIVENVSLVSAEKDGLMRKLLEFSEITMDDQGVDEPSSDPNLLVEKCIGKIRERMSISSQSALVEREHLQNLQSLLYVRDQELMLCKKMLEEEMFDRSHMANLSNELRRVTEELDASKAERDSLQKDLMRAEEKSSLIREKLSMAVKKGKGLVQEREGFKLSLDEKNAKIEKLTHELQQRDSDVSELIDQIKKLSIDVESIPKLESDAIAMREQKDKIEQLLLKNNDKLQALVASIERTVLPTDIVFEDHVEKLKWLSEYIHELQVGKTSIELELEKAKEEASQQVSRLVDAYATIKSLEDALSQANNNISILGIEKNDAEVGKIHAQKEFEKEKEEAGLLAQKLADAQETIKYLEDSLSEAEKNIFMLTSEMRDAEVGKAEVEKELEKVKEEACSQTSKLSDAYATITSLEVALSDAEKNISMLCETSKDVQVGKVSVEQELEKSKEEADSLASKLADTYLTIKSLEDRLAQAENKISKLSDEEEAESKSKQEITALNVKLAACLEDLAASDGKLQSHCSQMVTHVNHLETLMKEEGLFSLLNESFKIKFEGLRDMGLLLQSIRQQLAEKDSEQLQFHHGKVDPFATIHFSVPQFNDVNSIVVSDEISTADLVDNISSYLSKIVEGFNAQYKFLGEKIEGFSSSMDEHISHLLQELQITKDEVIRTLELVQSLKLNASKLEARNRAQESQIFTLKKSTSILLSAFTDATRELQSEIHNSWDPNSMPVLKSLNYSLYLGSREADAGVVEEQCDSFDTREYVKAAEDLLLAVRSFQAQSKYLENEKSVWLTTVNDLQNKLEESKIMAENAMHDRESNLNKISMLESDLESLNGYYTDLKLKIEDCQTKEEKLREKEAELSLLHHCLAEKDQEAEKCFLSADEMETLLDKVNKMEIISGESEADIRELNFPGPVDKLFYIIDNFVELQRRMNSLTHDKGELQLTLTAQVSEIEHLKQEAEILTRNNQDLERKMWDLEELTVGLDKLIHKLGGNDSVDDKKSFDAKGLLQVLEKLVITSLMEHENSKSKSQELGAKLNEKQMTLDQLSARVKLLEDPHHEKQAPSDTIQERSIFNASSLATGSEISEIEDVGPLGKNSISPALAAPHVRTMRKGSSDHLALSIDSESDRLISHHESDDKGHVFKSLNTSGLIPKQGKLIADKIDGIWVSGGRILMSRPGARIGLIAYWLLLHMWVLGTIL